MDAQQILSASVLDIVFDGRNKEYGAYILRKEYNHRLAVALWATAAFLFLLTIFFYSSNESVKFINPPILNAEVHLSELDKTIVQAPKQVTLRSSKKIKAGSYKNFSPFLVLEPVLKEIPPESDITGNSGSAVSIEDGPPSDAGVSAEGSSNGTDNTTDSIIKVKEADFSPEEIESAFPGGLAAWRTFLMRTLNYPGEAMDQGIQGSVIVQFIVNINGMVSEVEAVSGPTELRKEAVRVIQKSGRWSPAVQNGRKVKSYKKQPIVFLPSE